MELDWSEPDYADLHEMPTATTIWFSEGLMIVGVGHRTKVSYWPIFGEWYPSVQVWGKGGNDGSPPLYPDVWEDITQAYLKWLDKQIYGGSDG